MNITYFWEGYWICVFLYLALSFILYKIENSVYGWIDDSQLAAGIQLFLISFIPLVNMLLVVCFIIGMFIKIIIVIEDIFDGTSNIK